jgi:hypothetical protein
MANFIFIRKVPAIFAFILPFSLAKISTAQTSGDYRSKQSGAWNTASSWQTFNGSSWVDAVSFPSSTNGAITILPGDTIISNAVVTVDQLTINNGGVLSINSSSFTVVNGAGIDLSCSGNLALYNGTLNGDGTIKVVSGGVFNWQGGTIGGSGSITIAAGANLNMSSNSHFFGDTKLLTNAGTWTWTGGEFDFNAGSAAVNNIGTFNINTDADVTNAATNTSTFTSSGIINKIGNPGEETSFSGFSTFSNTGRINVNSSKLNIGAISTSITGVNSTSSGSIAVAFGATMRFTGKASNTANFSAGGLTGAGISIFEGPIVTINPSVVFSVSTINISGSTVNLHHKLTFGSGKTLNLAGGAFNTDSVVAFQSGSTLNWTGGSIGGAGVLNINKGTAFSISGVDHFLNDTITINNSATCTWTGDASRRLYFNTGSPVFNNSGIFNIQTDADVLNSLGAAGTFYNKQKGIINKLGSVSDETFFGGVDPSHNAMTFKNDGTVNINSGNLDISTVADYAGSFNVALGSALHFSGFTQQINHFDSGSSITGPGGLILDGSTLIFNTSSALTTQAIIINGGVLTIPGLTRTAGSYLNLGGSSILSGNSTISFNSGSVFTWSGGYISDSGSVEINEGAIFNMVGGTHILTQKRMLNNHTTWNWTGGNLQLIDSSLVVNNYGTLNINTDANVGIFRSGRFVNQPTGIINKTSTSNGQTSFGNASDQDGIFSSEGAVNILSGYLGIYYRGDLGGTLNIANGAGLRSDNIGLVFTGSSFVNNGTVVLNRDCSFKGSAVQSLSGTGSMDNLEINNANGVTLGGAQTITNELRLTTGKITLGNNDLILGANATIPAFGATSYVITNGTGSLQMQVPANTTWTFPVGSSGSYLPATIQLSAASTIDNFKVRVSPNIYGGYTAGNDPVGSGITSNVVNATWTVSELVAGGSDATIKLQWNAANEAGGFNRTTSRFGQYTNNVWVLDTVAAAQGSDPFTLTKSGVTAFGPFGVINRFVSCINTYASICTGSSVSVPYKAIGSFNAGNVFTAQLSNASGSFSAPVNIGSITSATSGNISATIPVSTAPGTGYRIRVKSSNPATTGVDNASDISIANCLNIAETKNDIKTDVNALVFDKILVYPNPTNDRLTIDAKLGKTKTGYADIRVMNIAGQVVYAEKAPIINNSLNKTISFNAVAKGVYILDIIVGNDVYRKKIVYQK